MNEDSKCKYPDWEGNLETNKHDYAKMGFVYFVEKKEMKENKS